MECDIVILRGSPQMVRRQQNCCYKAYQYREENTKTNIMNRGKSTRRIILTCVQLAFSNCYGEPDVHFYQC